MASVQTPARSEAAPDNSIEAATRVFSKSVLISGIRCTLAYVVFPFILPLFHISKSVGPYIGVVIGVIAIGFNIASIRRFWVSGHKWRWYMSALNVAVIVMLAILFVQDMRELTGKLRLGRTVPVRLGTSSPR